MPRWLPSATRRPIATSPSTCWWWTTGASMPPPRWSTAARHAHVPVEIISCRTRGKGAAVRTGIQRSSAPFVGYCDADLSTPPSALRMGIDLLRSGWEVVIGSRRCTGAGYEVPQGRMRRLGSFAFRTMASNLSGPITDTQCGFKLFHSDVAKSLFAESTADRLCLRRRGPGPGPPAQAPDDRAAHPVDRQPRVLVPAPRRRGEVVPRVARSPSIAGRRG